MSRRINTRIAITLAVASFRCPLFIGVAHFAIGRARAEVRILVVQLVVLARQSTLCNSAGQVILGRLVRVGIAAASRAARTS